MSIELPVFPIHVDSFAPEPYFDMGESDPIDQESSTSISVAGGRWLYGEAWVTLAAVTDIGSSVNKYIIAEITPSATPTGEIKAVSSKPLASEIDTKRLLIELVFEYYTNETGELPASVPWENTNVIKYWIRYQYGDILPVSDSVNRAGRWECEVDPADASKVQLGDGAWERNGIPLSWAGANPEGYIDAAGVIQVAYPNSATCKVVAILEYPNVVPPITWDQRDPALRPEVIKVYVIDGSSFVTGDDANHNGMVDLAEFTTDSGGNPEADSIVQLRSSDFEDQQEQLDSTAWWMDGTNTKLRDWFIFRGLPVTSMNYARKTLEYYTTNVYNPSYGVRQIRNVDTCADQSYCIPVFESSPFQTLDGADEVGGDIQWPVIDGGYNSSFTGKDQTTVSLHLDSTTEVAASPQEAPSLICIDDVWNCYDTDEGTNIQWAPMFVVSGYDDVPEPKGAMDWWAYDHTISTRVPYIQSFETVDENCDRLSIKGFGVADLGQVAWNNDLTANDREIEWAWVNYIDKDSEDE